MTCPSLRRSVVLSFLTIWLCLFPAVDRRQVLIADDDQKEKPAPPAQKLPEVPDLKALQDLLPKLFDPRPNPRRRNNWPRNRPTPIDNGAKTRSRDPVENRAPRDAKTDQLLQAADTAAEQKNWRAAVDLYQRLLDQPDDSLIRQSNGQWQSVRKTINQRLGLLPEATLVEYRSKYGGLARQQLSTAQQTGKTEDFVNVATRFFHTPAGYEAANYLAAEHFDRSEFAMAARWFADLSASTAPFVREDTWLLQAALALRAAGDVKGATTLLERLSQGPTTMVSVGTGTVKASDWVAQIESESSLPTNALVDWMQLYGTAARTGTAVGGDAILSPNWSLPLTSSQYIRNLLKWVIHDLQDQQRTLILAASPLVVDGRVIYRDLRGLRSVEIDSGHLLWEGLEGVSPERILGGIPSQQIDPQDAWRVQMNPFQNLGDYQGQPVENSPLTSLLFRDGTYGLISSDGSRIFVIEDHGILSTRQPGQNWGWDGGAEPQDLFGVPWKTNRLVAYDLHTGRVAWSLGGIDSRESFDLPLAGSYFYGTPAVDGDELFVVAGRGDEIRLWSIERRTGTPLWSQRIAYSDTKIDLDLVRRWNSSQVAVGSGIIVCPTTVGWLIAIDKMRQSVVWAYRYAPRPIEGQLDREAGTQLLPQRELNASWRPSAPVISGNCVVYTPQDEPVLICLNAMDGQRIWEKPKDTGTYLAGVFEQKVLVVGESEVVAYRLSDGESVWSHSIDEGVRVSGRGVVAKDRFYLPLNNGELRSIGLADGKTLSQSYVGSGQAPLGNLAMHHGKLVSLGPAGIAVFGQRDAVLADIQKRLDSDPADPSALLRSSEIQVLNRKYQDAIAALRRIVVDRLGPTEKTRWHTALVESLSTLIHTDVLHRDRELDELSRVAESPAETLLYQELMAEKLLAEHKPVEAFDLFCKLVKESGDTFVERRESRHIAARRSVWLSGRMSEIWSATPDAERPPIDERIRSLIAEVAERDLDAFYRIVTLFSFHPASIDAQERFVERLVEAGDACGARIILEQMLEHDDKRTAARAAERLARLMIDSKLPDDAVYYYRLIEALFADVMIRDGMNGAAIVVEALAANPKSFETRHSGIVWKSRPLRLQHSVMNYTPPAQDIVFETQLPFFNQLCLESYQNEQRLAIESIATGGVEMMIPLRSALRASDDGYVATHLIGHQMFFVNRGVLHAVSPIEKRVIWSKSLGDQFDGAAHPRHDGRPSITTMVGPDQDDSYSSLLMQQSYAVGQLSIVRPNYLCLHSRRSLTIIDPRTGSEMWRLDGLPMNSQIVGVRDALFVVVPGKSEALAYRALDGKPLVLPGLTKLLNSALLSHGSSLLVYEQRGANPLGVLGIRRGKTSKNSLRLYDPVARSTRWQLDFPAGTVISPLGHREAIAVQPDWQIKRIDVANGAMVSLEIPTNESLLSSKRDAFFEKYLIADADQIYLIVNRPDNDPQTFGESLASVRVNGVILAWNRHDNRFLWQNGVKDQNLVVDRISKMPILLFVSRSWRDRRGLNMNLGSLKIAAIHKQTGQKLIDSKIPAAYSAFHALTINPEEQTIDLKFYNVLLKLVSVDEAAAVEPKQPAEPGSP